MDYKEQVVEQVHLDHCMILGKTKHMLIILFNHSSLKHYYVSIISLSIRNRFSKFFIEETICIILK
jgi:hypothetical protein